MEKRNERFDHPSHDCIEIDIEYATQCQDLHIDDSVAPRFIASRALGFRLCCFILCRLDALFLSHMVSGEVESDCVGS